MPSRPYHQLCDGSVLQPNPAICGSHLCRGHSAGGLGAMTDDPNSGNWLLTNENSVATTQIGSIDEIQITANGPVVVK